MIQGNRILAIIPARGGSKELPQKNILPLAGKPLIAWTIDAAYGSRYLDRTLVSSDSAEIAEIAAEYDGDVPFIRPAQLATDSSPIVDTLLHAVGEVGPYDYLVLLQPTSPLRTSMDIDRALELTINHQVRSCVSVSEVQKSPYWMYECTESQRLKPIITSAEVRTRRQDLPKVYVLNGAVYVTRTDWLQVERGFLNDDTLAYVMPQERSLDVDSELDLKLAELLIHNRCAK